MSLMRQTFQPKLAPKVGLLLAWVLVGALLVTQFGLTRHVVEHVTNPVGFLRSIRECIPGTFTLAVETPDVGHTIEHGLLHDFCYEHCTMMGETALAAVLRRAGYERVCAWLAATAPQLKNGLSVVPVPAQIQAATA